MIHDLKTWPAMFDAAVRGLNRFQIRLDDRSYRVGDELVLREWEPDKARYTGRTLRVQVKYLLRGPILGLKEGWVCMSVDKFGT